MAGICGTRRSRVSAKVRYGQRVKQPLEATHDRHWPPVFGCPRCTPWREIRPPLSPAVYGRAGYNPPVFAHDLADGPETEPVEFAPTRGNGQAPARRA